MSDLEPILALIDRAWHEPQLLDEIDARSTAFIRDLPYDHHDYEPDTGRLRVWITLGHPEPCLQLATSRDALRRFQPGNWWIHEVTPCQYMGDRRSAAGEEGAWVWSDVCATPELAELHCVLLAWQFERDHLAKTGRIGLPEIRLSCQVRFDDREARLLDLLAQGAGVSPQLMAQRLATEALFHAETRDAAAKRSEGSCRSSN